jgi:hypothetical protein
MSLAAVRCCIPVIAGWYLLAPHAIGFGDGAHVDDGPLSSWQQLAVFDSASECATARTFLRNTVEKVATNEWMSEAFASGRQREIVLLATLGPAESLLTVR